MAARRILLIAFITMMTIPLAIGQWNQPSRQYTRKEKEALFKKNLELDTIPSGAVELELKTLIPLDEEIEEKGIFFRNVTSFSVDERGHVYIPESHFIAVYEFNTNGRLLKKYDKKGQGPGELQFPSEIFFLDKQIVVDDSLPRRLAFFDRDWKFQRGFSYHKYYRDFTSGKNGRIYVISLNGDALVEVLDREGKGINSFGAIPFKKGSTLNSAVLGVSPSGVVWVGLTALGKLRKYSSEGSLQKEIDITRISSQRIKNDLMQNFEWQKKGEPKQTPLVQKISFIGEDALIQLGGLVHPIYRLTPEGLLKKVYYIKPNNYYINYSGLSVRLDKNGEETFYIYRGDYEEDDRRVGIYVKKKNEVSPSK